MPMQGDPSAAEVVEQGLCPMTARRGRHRHRHRHREQQRERRRAPETATRFRLTSTKSPPMARTGWSFGRALISRQTPPTRNGTWTGWLCGRERLDTTPDVLADESLPRLLAALRASDETVCLCAAYALAAMGAPAVPAVAGAGRGSARGGASPVPAQCGEIASQPGGRQSERALCRARVQRRGLSGGGRVERGTA